jgi:hypothetical protein
VVIHRRRTPKFGLAAVIRDTPRLWRRHGLGYDQTKYVVEHVHRELALTQPTGRRCSVDRLDRSKSSV